MIGEALVFLLILTRVSVFIGFFPLFSRRQLPSRVKIGLSMALSFFWLGETDPGFSAEALLDAGPLLFVFYVAKEVGIGILLSILLGLFLWPSRVAGAYIGQELGLSLASISDPGSQDSSTLITRLFEAFTVLIFFSINLHHFVIMVVHFSFDDALLQLGLVDLPYEALVTAMNRTNDYGLLIVAPLMILLMLITLVLGFLNRAAPAMNLFSVGMSIRVGIGGLLLFLFSPLLFGATEIYLYRIQEDIEALLSALLG
jgi:flagellar biosynthetic protein FliR